MPNIRLFPFRSTLGKACHTEGFDEQLQLPRPHWLLARRLDRRSLRSHPLGEPAAHAGHVIGHAQLLGRIRAEGRQRLPRLLVHLL